MKTTFLASVSLLAVTMVLNLPAQTQVSPPLYQIDSGTYVEEGGFAGELTYHLPAFDQAFVSLLTDPATHRSELTFLDRNLRPSYFPTLTNGVKSADRLFFRYQTMFPVFVENITTVNYQVTSNADNLLIEGSAAISYAPCHCVCFDCYTGFAHHAVRATRVPIVSIRVTDHIELCWDTIPNKNYQLFYATELSPVTSWSALGRPVTGLGSTICRADALPLQGQQRFYRVSVQP